MSGPAPSGVVPEHRVRQAGRLAPDGVHRSARTTGGIAPQRAPLDGEILRPDRTAVHSRRVLAELAVRHDKVRAARPEGPDRAAVVGRVPDEATVHHGRRLGDGDDRPSTRSPQVLDELAATNRQLVGLQRLGQRDRTATDVRRVPHERAAVHDVRAIDPDGAPLVRGLVVRERAPPERRHSRGRADVDTAAGVVRDHAVDHLEVTRPLDGRGPRAGLSAAVERAPHAANREAGVGRRGDVHRHDAPPVVGRVVHEGHVDDVDSGALDLQRRIAGHEAGPRQHEAFDMNVGAESVEQPTDGLLPVQHGLGQGAGALNDSGLVAQEPAVHRHPAVDLQQRRRQTDLGVRARGDPDGVRGGRNRHGVVDRREGGLPGLTVSAVGGRDVHETYAGGLVGLLVPIVVQAVVTDLGHRAGQAAPRATHGDHAPDRRAVGVVGAGLLAQRRHAPLRRIAGLGTTVHRLSRYAVPKRTDVLVAQVGFEGPAVLLFVDALPIQARLERARVPIVTVGVDDTVGPRLRQVHAIQQGGVTQVQRAGLPVVAHLGVGQVLAAERRIVAVDRAAHRVVAVRRGRRSATVAVARAPRHPVDPYLATTRRGRVPMAQVHADRGHVDGQRPTLHVRPHAADQLLQLQQRIRAPKADVERAGGPGLGAQVHIGVEHVPAVLRILQHAVHEQLRRVGLRRPAVRQSHPALDRLDAVAVPPGVADHLDLEIPRQRELPVPVHQPVVRGERQRAPTEHRGAPRLRAPGRRHRVRRRPGAARHLADAVHTGRAQRARAARVVRRIPAARRDARRRHPDTVPAAARL